MINKIISGLPRTKTFSQLLTVLAISLLILVVIAPRTRDWTRPIVDRHSWRQSETYAIALNYLADGFDFFSPRTFAIHPEGNVNRLFLGELPVYEFSLALFFKLFGENIIIARAYSVFLTLLTTLAVYIIGQRLFNQPTGFISAVAFNLFPASVFWGRSILPEILALTLATWAIALFIHSSPRRILLSAGLLGVAIAIKPYYLSLLVLFVAEWKFASLNLNKSARLLCWFLILTPFFIWLMRRFGIPENMRYPGSILFHLYGYQNPISYLRDFNVAEFLLKERLLGEILTPLGGILLLITPFISNSHKKNQPDFLVIWLIIAISSLFIVAWGNFAHDYYQLMLLPVAALCAGCVILKLWQQLINLFKSANIAVLPWIAGTVFSGYFLGFVPYQNYIDRYFAPEVRYQEFSEDLNRIRTLIPGAQRVLVVDFKENEGNPIFLNHLKRNGWVMVLDDVCNFSQYIEQLPRYQALGAQFLVLPKVSYLINRRECDRAEVMADIKSHYALTYEGNYLLLAKL